MSEDTQPQTPPLGPPEPEGASEPRLDALQLCINSGMSKRSAQTLCEKMTEDERKAIESEHKSTLFGKIQEVRQAVQKRILGQEIKGKGSE